mmetsp:Transcript_9215/g.20453  ORF Transcript_9215/g.20453 Transcript_9215/m.20453 type:complete len:87 (-) Transcript_9215:167-427(-)
MTRAAEVPGPRCWSASNICPLSRAAERCGVRGESAFSASAFQPPQPPQPVAASRCSACKKCTRHGDTASQHCSTEALVGLALLWAG